MDRKGFEPQRSGKKRGLGTFAGVFTPSILTILGIILFLRTGYVVGHTGLAWTLIIIGGANLISLATATSLSAIATNIRVKGGGDYYLISRTPGVEYGGAIGVVLFLAQTVSIAFYCFGFGEAVVGIFADVPGLSPRWVAAALAAVLFFFAWLGSDWASKLQFVIMSILAAALLSFFVGGSLAWTTSTFLGNWNLSSANSYSSQNLAVFVSLSSSSNWLRYSRNARCPRPSRPPDRYRCPPDATRWNTIGDCRIRAPAAPTAGREPVTTASAGSASDRPIYSRLVCGAHAPCQASSLRHCFEACHDPAVSSLACETQIPGTVFADEETCQARPERPIGGTHRSHCGSEAQ